MSLRLRRVTVSNFRKFRQPVVVDGLSDGLNIIIEPNETGKSTLLEALRAAFFVRHGTKNQLAQSYAPHGDAVAPEVRVDFEADGVGWQVMKRFLKNPMAEVSSLGSRAQGEEAENRLHALLGSVKDTSQRGDPSLHGALGLLWVAQSEALAVTAPSQIVRERVRSTLEGEVGTIMGGTAYRRVRDRIDRQFGDYWSPTGQRRGRQAEARERLDTAETKAKEAAERLAALEQDFSELEIARARLKVLTRDVADGADATKRKDLQTSLETARIAAQVLATRRAERDTADAQVIALDDLDQRHVAAAGAAAKAAQSLATLQIEHSQFQTELGTAKGRLSEARVALTTAQAARDAARDALAAGEVLDRRLRRARAIGAARARHTELLAYEDQLATARKAGATLIPAKVIAELEASDRAVAQARAVLAAGATVIQLTGSAPQVTIDGAPMGSEPRTITSEVRIAVGGGSILLVRPPAVAASAEEQLAQALDRERRALAAAGAADLSEARAQNDSARDAASLMKILEARIAAVTPADGELDLAAGSAALKLLVAGLSDQDAPTHERPDLPGLSTQLAKRETEVARCEGVHQAALDALRKLEGAETLLATREASARSDFDGAEAQRRAIEGRSEFPSLTSRLSATREKAVQAAVALAQAERDASVHDIATIARKIELIDARARAGTDACNRAETDIARLGGIVESEGGKGLAERAVTADEEVEAARIALLSVTQEAETLKLLRDTLGEVQAETSGKFVGPVAHRAKRHIERLLPGCEPSFSEDLALDGIMRGGISEACLSLSKGTQEQLAVLTRLAFADILLEQGRPVSLILDDPLVYSDDARLDLMSDILADAAGRMQVILFTCRDRAFRHLPGNRVILGPNSLSSGALQDGRSSP